MSKAELLPPPHAPPKKHSIPSYARNRLCVRVGTCLIQGLSATVARSIARKRTGSGLQFPTQVGRVFVNSADDVNGVLIGNTHFVLYHVQAEQGGAAFDDFQGRPDSFQVSAFGPFV